MESTFTTPKDKNSKFTISCKITTYQSCQETFIPFFKYTEYKIILKTNKKCWEIRKRYKDFDELHKKLSKSIKNLNKLPIKTIFKSDEIINDRKIKLQKYLTNLLRRDDVYKHDLLFDFVELSKEDYLLMKDNLEDDNSGENSPVSRSNRESLLNFRSLIESKNREDTVINDNFYYSFLNLKEENVEQNNFIKKLVNSFLNDLNSKKNDMTLIIKNFREEFLFQHKKKNTVFKNEDIYRLFFGDKTTKQNGLLYYCGDVNGNLLGAEICIEFLSNLVDFEYNLESEFFTNILRVGKLENFKQMNFAYHLESGKPLLFFYCCRIIRLIINEEKSITVESLFNKDTLIEKVNKYISSSEVL